MHLYLVTLKQAIDLYNKRKMGKFNNFTKENISRSADEISL